MDGYHEYKQLTEPHTFAADFLSLPCQSRIGYSLAESSVIATPESQKEAQGSVIATLESQKEAQGSVIATLESQKEAP